MIIRALSFDIIMTDDQYQRAVKVGTLRYNESIKRRCQQAYGAGGYNLNMDILGAAGEFAYCIYTNQPWSESVNTFKAPDVGTNVQIRTTDKLQGKLIVRKRDKDEDLFVLVLAEGLRFKIVGSMLGKDAKNPEYLFAPNGRPPAYFVKQEFLAKIDDKREGRSEEHSFVENFSLFDSTENNACEINVETEICPECQGEGRIPIESDDLYVECLLCGSTGVLSKKLIDAIAKANERGVISG
jgi:hypothetical protein